MYQEESITIVSILNNYGLDIAVACLKALDKATKEFLEKELEYYKKLNEQEDNDDYTFSAWDRRIVEAKKQGFQKGFIQGYIEGYTSEIKKLTSIKSNKEIADLLGLDITFVQNLLND